LAELNGLHAILIQLFLNDFYSNLKELIENIKINDRDVEREGRGTEVSADHGILIQINLHRKETI